MKGCHCGQPKVVQESINSLIILAEVGKNIEVHIKGNNNQICTYAFCISRQLCYGVEWFLKSLDAYEKWICFNSQKMVHICM